MRCRKEVILPSLLQGEERGDLEENHVHYHGVDKASQHISYEDALQSFLKEISPVKKTESVGLYDSLGRVLSEDIKAELDVPAQSRSTRDGYALKLKTSGASAGSTFKITGEVKIGEKPRLELKDGEAIKVATGSFLPRGSNAVVMKEYVERKTTPGGGRLTEILQITRQTFPRENILEAGEDLAKGSTVLLRGTLLKPHHLALLSMVGRKQVKVYARPRIAFFSTGDELVDSRTAGNSKEEKTRDANRPFIDAMLRQLGALPVDLGIVKDDFKSISKTLLKGLRYDALILSAGSSVGDRDYVSRAFESIREAKILVHGVAMRPSSPTGLGVFREHAPFIMLPGFPTSMIVSFLVFARPAILKLSGASSSNLLTPMFKVRLEESYSGRSGLTHFLRLKIQERNGTRVARIAKPTEAQYSSWLKETNGIGILRPRKSSAAKGEEIDAFLM